MNRCPITYESTDSKYSTTGLSKLSSNLKELKDLPFSAQEQRREAALRVGKMSIQGVQPKLSARLYPSKSELRIVDQKGSYIIKPQSDVFLQVPENEDLTMKMAKYFGIEVPLTGLVYSKDGSMSYFVKRFDRYNRNRKYHQEDFAQLTGNKRDTKYRSSMEKLIPVIEAYCTFPVLEKRKLFRRVLFCFITGNEDMHLKNFTLITRGLKVALSPAYDLLNSSIAMGGATEEFALPINGKKSNVTSTILFKYYGKERLGLNDKILNTEIINLKERKSGLKNWIERSFLSPEMREQYIELMEDRINRII